MYTRGWSLGSLLLLMASQAGAQVLSLPPRPADAMTGIELSAFAAPLSLEEREEALLREILAGNVPDFLRTLSPVTVTASVGEATRTATYHVTADYFALGSEADYFLMPMTPMLAQRVADLLGCNLPTRKMVNDIYAAAAVKLAPSPIPPSPEMTTVPVFWQHNLTVRGQRAAYLATHPLGALVGGDKKDVVVTPLLATRPDRVAIYGWHQLSGQPIQPLYLGHVNTWVDYSHGIRLVQLAMTVDGEATTVPAVLADPELSALLSDEGPFEHPRYAIPSTSSLLTR